MRANEPISDELWHREIVFAVEKPNGAWLPAAMTRRVQANRGLEADLRTLLPAAERFLKDKYYRRIEYVATLLENTPQLESLFVAHELDPVALFGSEQEAKIALGRQRPGARSSGIINHFDRAQISIGGNVVREATGTLTKRGRPPVRDESKQQVTLRLPRDVIAHFKAGGPGWQTRISGVLKRYASKDSRRRA